MNQSVLDDSTWDRAQDSWKLQAESHSGLSDRKIINAKQRKHFDEELWYGYEFQMGFVSPIIWEVIESNFD